MADDKWQMADDKWQMADDKWQMADDKWQMASTRSRLWYLIWQRLEFTFRDALQVLEEGLAPSGFAVGLLRRISALSRAGGLGVLQRLDPSPELPGDLENHFLDASGTSPSANRLPRMRLQTCVIDLTSPRGAPRNVEKRDQLVSECPFQSLRRCCSR